MTDREWGVRYPNGEIEQAGILGENRARMLAAKYGGEVIDLTDPAEHTPEETP